MQPNSLQKRLEQAQSMGVCNLSNMDLLIFPKELFSIMEQTFGDSNKQGWWEREEIEALDLSSNKISVIPDEIAKFGNSLKRLVLRDNQFQQLGSNLRYLMEIVQIDVSHNQISEFDAFLFPNISKLSELIASSNQITQIPANLFSCQMLSRLDLSHNRLSKLPEMDEIPPLLHLQVLQLSDNLISSLPNAIFAKCVALRELDCSKNQLSNLSSMSELKSLTIVNLRENRLKRIPEFRKKKNNLTQRLNSFGGDITKKKNSQVFTKSERNLVGH